jgi:hypothetical protein
MPELMQRDKNFAMNLLIDMLEPRKDVMGVNGETGKVEAPPM